MKIKRKNSRLESRINRQRLELESALIQSNFDALDLVNPNDAYLDPSTGEMWLPLGAGSDVDNITAPFRTEMELRLIRQRARITALKNPYAKNLLNSITAFTVGKGHKYTATMRKNVPPNEQAVAKQHAKRVQRYLDKLLKMNKWPRRQRQTVWRYHRDGEVFIRIFYQEDGFALYRFVEPAEVSTTEEWSQDENASFGIITDEEDVETVEFYIINGEKVPVEEVQHRKANVDMNMKRGLSTLFTIREHLDRALKLLRNMSITVANQTAMTMFRHHKATGKQVQSFAAKAAKAVRADRYGVEQRQSSFAPGTVFDVVDGKTRYEFPGGGLNAANPVQVLAAELRAIASSMSWPEFMIGSDAANANYSSTMVAENPAVKSIETEQAENISDDLDLIWAAVEHAVNVGRLPPETLTLVEIEVEPPVVVARNPKEQADTDEVLHRIRVKSPQTIASGYGLDWSQEVANFSEHEDADLDGGALSGPLSGASITDADDLAKTALNGAQVAALVEILQQAAIGAIPKGSVAPIIEAAFPNLTTDAVQRIVKPLENFKADPATLKVAA